MNIGEAVSTAMMNIKIETGMSIMQIVDGANISGAAISQAVRGVTRYPNILTIHEFCCGTGYTLEEFFARKEFDDLE